MTTIPPITDPLGRAWQQPDRTEIAIADDLAEMNSRALAQLLEYSSSLPSAVYVGKMWKAKVGDGWVLRWYDVSEKGDEYCSIQQRSIKLVNQ